MGQMRLQSRSEYRWTGQCNIANAVRWYWKRSLPDICGTAPLTAISIELSSAEMTTPVIQKMFKVPTIAQIGNFPPDPGATIRCCRFPGAIAPVMRRCPFAVSRKHRALNILLAMVRDRRSLSWATMTLPESKSFRVSTVAGTPRFTNHLFLLHHCGLGVDGRCQRAAFGSPIFDVFVDRFRLRLGDPLFIDTMPLSARIAAAITIASH